MIFSNYCALSRVCLRFLFVSCKTTQNKNISQLLTGSKFKVSKRPPLLMRSFVLRFLTYHLIKQLLSCRYSKNWQASKISYVVRNEYIDSHSIERELIHSTNWKSSFILSKAVFLTSEQLEAWTTLICFSFFLQKTRQTWTRRNRRAKWSQKTQEEETKEGQFIWQRGRVQ